MGRARAAAAAIVLGAAIAAQGAGAQTVTEPLPPPVVAPPEPAPAPAPAPAPMPPEPTPEQDSDKDGGKGGQKPKGGGNDKRKPKRPDPEETGGTGATKKGESGEIGSDAPEDQAAAALPFPAPAACGPTVAPAFLIPIYQDASKKYGLGPAGPSILAAINEIESNFGQNQGPSSAGAVGWMQFLPSTWATYGVDANGDGSRDPSNPEDAIHAAARYLSAAGMPDDPEGAIFAYNHADWYVADVLSRAACYGGLGAGALSLIPKRQQLVCAPAEDAGVTIPPGYLEAFQAAAGRYELEEETVWALAAIARLESDYGRGMSEAELRERGPLGISPANWEQYAVDGDGDGKILRESPGDSAATLARMVWAAGSLRAGIFQHNHAAWYVQEVLDEAEPLSGKCRVRTVSYAIALPGPSALPINWENLELSNSLEFWDLQQGTVDPRVLVLIAAISQEHTIRISSLRSDHSMNTASGNVSNHFFGRAVDIAAIDGVPCTVTDPEGPCGTIARALAQLPPAQRPTELIYCFDPDGPAGRAWAQADHCDHIHAGFDR